MDGAVKYGKCGICGGTLSLHINVSKPLDHKWDFGKKDLNDANLSELRTPHSK